MHTQKHSTVSIEDQRNQTPSAGVNRKSMKLNNVRLEPIEYRQSQKLFCVSQPKVNRIIMHDSVQKRV